MRITHERDRAKSHDRASGIHTRARGQKEQSKGDQELVADVPLGHLGPPAHHMTPHGACIPTTI